MTGLDYLGRPADAHDRMLDLGNMYDGPIPEGEKRAARNPDGVLGAAVGSALADIRFLRARSRDAIRAIRAIRTIKHAAMQGFRIEARKANSEMHRAAIADLKMYRASMAEHWRYVRQQRAEIASRKNAARVLGAIMGPNDAR